MFWKKKTKDPQKYQHLKAAPDHRLAFRVTPSRAQPILLDFGKKSVLAEDISSGGLSFKNIGLQPGSLVSVRFILPVEEVAIKSDLKILRIGKNGICHGKFMNLQESMQDQIHKYVLFRQKERMQ